MIASKHSFSLSISTAWLQRQQETARIGTVSVVAQHENATVKCQYDRRVNVDTFPHLFVVGGKKTRTPPPTYLYYGTAIVAERDQQRDLQQSIKQINKQLVM